MNKIYKLVYSKALNSLVAVSEIATRSTAAKDAKANVNETDVLSGGSKKANLNKLALTFVLSSLFAGLPLGVSANTGPQVSKKVVGDVATATVDSSAETATHLNYISDAGYSATNAGVVAEATGPQVKYVNGVPVVDIVNANQNGVSDNRFTKFSTDTGVVFNNLKAGSVAVDSKVLQEKLAANPNLQNAARTILAQITGSDKSVIKGAMEVLGQKADLLVINPNGVDLNGVELINAKSFTASTADVNANNWKELNVTRGEVNVNDTLTSQDVEVIRLIAAAVKINAKIAPKDNNSRKANIVVAGGKQKYDLVHERAIKTDNTPNAKKQVVISGSALGAMYGNKINFVVTQSGAGIEYDGTIIGEEDLQITADGDIKFSGEKAISYAKGNNKIESKNGSVTFENNAAAKSLQKVVVKANEITASQGTLHASKAVEVEADVARLGNVQASMVKIAAKRFVTTAADTTIRANELDVKFAQIGVFDGKVVANTNLKINADNGKVLTTSKLKFNDEVVASGNADIKVGSVTFSGNNTAEEVNNALTKALFRFNTLNLEVNAPYALNSDNAPVSLVNGKLVTNNFNLSTFSGANFNSELVKADNGQFRVYKTAFVNTTKDGFNDNIITDNQFSNLNKTVNTLNATKTKLKINNLSLSEHQELGFDRSVELVVNDFNSAGVIKTGGSFSVESANEFTNNGLLFVKGNLAINAKRQVNLGGAVWAYADLDIKAPSIFQSSQVNVGGNMNVVADLYNMYSNNKGNVKLVTDRTWKESTNWHHHALRKDKYKLGLWGAKVDTSEIQFNTVETSVLGNFNLTPYTNADAANAKASFKMENGRLFVGGTAHFQGDVTVKTNTFKVGVKELLNFQNGMQLVFAPISLLNTYLTGASNIVFTSLYEMLDKTLVGTSRDMIRRNVMGYRILQDQIMNTLKQMNNLDPVYKQILSSVFGANWKGLGYKELAKRWNFFKANPEKFNIAIFAPSSEIFTNGAFTQENGKVFIGADTKGVEVKKVNRAKYGLGTEVLVENSESVLIAQKLDGVKTYDSYLDQLKTQIAKVDGKYVATHVADWEKGIDFTSTRKGINGRVNADNNALGLIIYEQFKDRVGGYGASGRDPKAVLQHLINSSNKARQIEASIYRRGDVWGATIEGKDKKFVNVEDIRNYVKANYDRIIWEENEEGVLVPRLHLSMPTLQKTTNFNEVAGSVSSSTSIRINNADSVDVVYGSINSKRVEINTKGGINLVGLAGQNSINSDETVLNAQDDIHSVGNMKLGDAQIETLGDANFESVAFFTEEGYHGHQGLIKTKDVVIKAKNVNLDAVDVKAKGDATVTATEDVNLKATHDEASTFKSIAAENEHSGRQISQEGQFVHGSSIDADNVDVNAKNVNLESSKLKAKETANINVEENLTTTAKANQKHNKGVEEKVQGILSAKASFGSTEAGAAYQVLDNRDINGKLDEKKATYATAMADTTTNGAGAATAGATLNKQTTKLETYDAKHVNNELNADNLNVNVGKKAELGNTNINTDGTGVTAKDLEKTATIKAAEVSQNNAKDVTRLQQDKNAWVYQAGAYVGSSVVDAASHVTSLARTPALKEKIDPTAALTMVGDAIGLLTKDAISAGVRVSLSHNKSGSVSRTEEDSRNAVAGTLNIETTGATKLKAIDGTLKNLNVKAESFEVEGGVSQNKRKTYSDTSSLGVDVGVGAGIAGVTGSLSASASGSHSTSETERLTHQNSRLNVAGDVDIETKKNITLKSTVVSADGAVKAKAKELTVISELDTETSSAKGNGYSVSGGTSLGTNPVPFGSGGAYHEKHWSNKEVVGVASGIKGKTIGVDADKLNLEGAVLAAREGGKLNVKEINTKNLEVKEHSDGFKVGGTIGTNAGGAIIANVNGGRDAQRHYEAKVKSTISDNLEINPEATINSEGELNRDVNKVVEVTRDENVQDTKFDITVSSTFFNDARDALHTLKEKAGNLAETVKSYVGGKIKNAANGADHYVGNSEVAGYNTHYVSALDPSCYTCSNYANTATNPYATNFGNSGYESAGAFAKGTSNPYATYGGGRFNSDGTFTSAHGNSGLDFNSVSMDSDLINKTFMPDKGNHTQAMSNTQFSYGTLSSAERGAGVEGVRRVAGDTAMKDGVDDSNSVIRDINFGSVLANVRHTATEDSVNDIDFIGENPSSTNSTPTSTPVDFGGNDFNGRDNAASVDFGGFTPAAAADKDFNTANKEISKELEAHTASINNGISGGNSSSSNGAGFGTGTGEGSSFGGNGSGVNYGTAGNGASSNGSGASFGGISGNSGASGANNSVDFGGTDASTGGFDLDFTGNNGSTSTPVAGDTVGGNGGAASTGGATVTETTTNIITGGTSSIESGKVSASDATTSTSGDSSSTASNGSVANNGSTASAGTTSSTSSSSSSSSDNSSSSSSADSSSTSGSVLASVGGEETTTESSVVEETTNKEYSPADGNANAGDVIDMSNNSKVTKYQVGDLSCYVLNSNTAAKQKLENADANSQSFKEFVANTTKARATLFSKYSQGFESALGNGGVICVPNSSEVMKTDYNVYKSAGDIPVIKSEKPLEAVIVTEQKVVKVKVVSNSDTKVEKVVYQPTAVKVQEVKRIKQTLASKGLDSNKIMILGIKNGSTDSVAKTLEKKASKTSY